MLKNVLFVLVLAALVPFREELARSPFLYMFGHSSWLHYGVNAFSWLCLCNITTTRRTVMAYMVAVVVWLAARAVGINTPVLGWSVIIYYYIGLLLPGLPRKRCWRIVALTLLGFLIPGLAAAHHLTMLVVAWAFRKLEIKWQRTK